jgi:hypothetical protein
MEPSEETTCTYMMALLEVDQCGEQKEEEGANSDTKPFFLENASVQLHVHR